MSEHTNIEWCDATFNPWIGCTRVSPACDDCYAARSTPARTLGVTWGAREPRHLTAPSTWKHPLQWERSHEDFERLHGRRRRVFCASLADVFDNEVPYLWRVDLFRLIADTPHLDWLLLTKRIGNARDMIEEAVDDNSLPTWPWPNVWIGATVVNQEEVDRDIPKLLRVPARLHFLSIEPILGPISLHRFMGQGFGPAPMWVIAGGESGPKARPMHPDWARSLRDQCAAVGAPFLFKQWGEHDLSYDRDRDDPGCRRCAAMARKPGRWINLKGGHGFNGERVHYAERVGKKAAGRLLDGIEHNGFPEVACR